MRIQEIAELAGVSQATVSLVINNKEGVSSKTREHVRQVMQENNYHMDKISAAKAHLERICIVRFMHASSPIEDQSFILSLRENLYDICYQNKIKPFVMMCNESNYQEILRSAVSSACDAIVLIAMESTPQQIEFIKNMDFCKLPLVVLGNDMVDSDISSVNLANREESYMAVKYLYSNGFRSVGYLHSSIVEWGFQERAIGFDQAIKDLKIECPLKINLQSTISGAYRDMCNWLKRGEAMPRAFYADNDNTALGVMRALKEVGYRIPEDVSLIGMDDIVYSAISDCPLTTIHISRFQLARAAVNTLLYESAENAVRIVCRGRLIVRESTRPFDPEHESPMVSQPESAKAE